MDNNKSLTTSNQSSGLSKQTSTSLTQETQLENNEAAITAVSTKARAEVESALIMARKFPRNEDDIRTRVLKTCSYYSFAEKAKYKKPQGKVLQGKQWVQNYVVGPSIRLAEELFRQWGNITFETTVLYENSRVRIMSCRAMDLQTLATSTAQYIIEKTVERKVTTGREVISERLNSSNEKVSLVVATEDEVFSKQNNIGSKYRRNLIIQLIPTHLLRDAIQVIDVTISTGIKENPDKAKLDMLDSFATIGILASDLEKYLNHPMAQIMPEEIQELMDVFTAIHERETTWIEVLEEKNKAPEEKKVASMESGFKPGNAGTHSSVTDPVLTEKMSLIKELEAMHKVNPMNVNAVLEANGYKEVKDITTVEKLREIITILNWK